MNADLADSVYHSTVQTIRCPQCETAIPQTASSGRADCPQCGFRFCPECYYYRHRLETDFCLACGATFVAPSERRVPVLPAYLEQYVARSVSVINVWFLAWLTLSLSGGPIWLYGLVWGTMSVYWLLHFWRFRKRTGLAQASRYIGGIGLSVILTMVALILLQFWLIRPPVQWQNIELWAFILVSMLIIPLGVMWPPALMQARFGSEIAKEALTYVSRWAALERMGYLDTLLLRIPNVKHLPPVSHVPANPAQEE